MVSAIRRRQVNNVAALARALGQSNKIAPLLQRLGSGRFGQRLLPALIGPYRLYDNFDQAREHLSGYQRLGHESQENMQLHLDLSSDLRPSDYAAIYNLQPRASELNCVVDYGGNCGNLYYLYASKLNLPDANRWIVFDLPKCTSFGEKLAREREATALEFTNSPPLDASVDLLLFSGALHYFPEPLSALLGQYKKRPTYVMVNRTPFTTRDTCITAQRSGDFIEPCILRNYDEFLQEMKELSYRPVDQWQVPELSLSIPFRPKDSVMEYSGVFFEADR